MFGYYQIKPIRNGLLLAAHPAEIQSYLAIPQALLFIFVVKLFARLASRVPRHLLITYVTLFCVSNLVLFNILSWAGVPVPGWASSSSSGSGCTTCSSRPSSGASPTTSTAEEEGKRLFPMIAFGASLGAVVGPMFAKLIIPALGSYGMMLARLGDHRRLPPPDLGHPPPRSPRAPRPAAAERGRPPRQGAAARADRRLPARLRRAATFSSSPS